LDNQAPFLASMRLDPGC